MKQIVLLIVLLLVSGCVNEIKKEPPPTTISPETRSQTIPQSDTVTNSNLLSESEAVSLVQSKLSQEALRVSTISFERQDEDGNYVIRQSSKATTVVMEWYHVNPKTNEISREILKGMSINQPEDSSSVNIEKKMNNRQLKALDLAKKFAKEHYGYEYNENYTYIELDHEDKNGLITFHIYNPGSGMTDTIDWLTVDLDKNTLDSMFYKEETATKRTYEK